MEKVGFTTIYFTGPALTWFIHKEKKGKVFSSLEELLNGVKKVCNLNDDQNKDEDAFHDLVQTGSVTEYVTTFEELRLRLNDVSEAEAIRKFTGGLKPHVRKALRREAAHLNTRLTLDQAMDLALVEDPAQTPRARPPVLTPATRNQAPDAMDLDTVDARGKLRPLTDAQRNWLRDNNGCFACRRLGHHQGSADCPKKNMITRKGPGPPPQRRKMRTTSTLMRWNPTNLRRFTIPIAMGTCRLT